MKCDNCTHIGLCLFEKDLRQLNSECKEKLTLQEYKNFNVEVKCNHFVLNSSVRDYTK